MLVKNRQYKPAPPVFGAPVGVTPLKFRQIFGIRKLKYPGYRMALFA